MQTILLIIIMACITFSCRYLFFSQTLRLEIGPKLKKALTFTAPSVLTAMWVPIVFSDSSSGFGNIFLSAYFYAGLLAVYLSLKTEKTLLVVVGSMSLFFALNKLI